MITEVVKRGGLIVPFDPDKLNKWVEDASVFGVDWSSIALGAYKKCFNKCTTEDLHKALIAECVDRETIPHLKMAGRLYAGLVCKQVYGGLSLIPSLPEMYRKMVGLGLWEDMGYSDKELQWLDSLIDHSRDLSYSFPELKQVCEKYAIKDRVEDKLLETPQFVYMRMAMGLAQNSADNVWKKDVSSWYDAFSKKRINAPTPNSLNLGTPKKNYASCCVITTKDTAASLAAADHIAYVMTCASSGIGHHIKSRSKGDKVRKGLVQHMGKLPYYKVSQAVVGANLQASRGGALTMHYNVLDPEIEDLLVLRNVQTVEQKRIKDIDYSFGDNAFFAKKVAKNESWMLVSYGDAPELYEALYSGDSAEFVRLYIEVENNSKIPKRFVEARKIALMALKESEETGRQYFHHIDEMNRHTPFKDKIYSSNLCAEIGLPTKGYDSVADLYQEEAGDGEIGLCNLGAIDAAIESEEEYEETAYYALKMADTVISIMDYPFPQLKTTAQARRSVGIGITNLAYALAKKGLKYSSIEGKRFIHTLAEKHSYMLHKASIRLAKELGVCEWAEKTKYPDGWLPIDTRNTTVSDKYGFELKYNWEELRAEIIKLGGIRNSVLEAHMPCESSAVASGHTNGLYPLRDLVVIKTSGTNKTLFIAPDMDTLGSQYELAWDIPHEDLAECYSLIQGFTGQAISADFYRRFAVGSDRQVGTKTLLEEYLRCIKLGLKTKYYQNSSTGVSNAADDCESCKL